MNLSSLKIFVIFLICLSLQSPRTSSPTAAKGSTSQTEHVINANVAEFEWAPMVPQMGKDSPVITVMHEHPETHSSQFSIRMPPNFHVPAHFHSANETHTVIEGTFIIEAEGKRVSLTQGGFNYIPARVVHETWTPPDKGALIFVTVDGPYDLFQK